MAVAQVHVERGQRSVGVSRGNAMNVKRSDASSDGAAAVVVVRGWQGFAVDCDVCVCRRRRRCPGRRSTDADLEIIRLFYFS